MAAIRVGVGGWTFPPWRGNFFPAGLPHARELAYAAERLTAIEINGTFYRHQSAASFARWRSDVPPGFVFSVKAHRATTHGKDLAASFPAIERFLNSGLVALGPALGPILWQLPPTRRFEAASFAAWLGQLPRTLEGQTLRHAIEARHPSFACEAAVRLCRDAGVARVIVDSDTHPLHGDITADFVYARLQRNDAAFDHGYAPAALQDWARRAQAWRDGKKVDLPRLAPSARSRCRDVFCFFISGQKEVAPRAAMRFLDLVGREVDGPYPGAGG